MSISGCMAVALMLALCSGASGQTTLYVDDDNCPGPGSGSLVDPFCSIQDAIVATLDGDTVEVAPGTYFEAINFLGKAITLRSREGSATTIIDATNVPAAGETVSVVRCVNGETSATVLDGFTITGGTGTEDATISMFTEGGGMLNHGSSPTVTNCIFSSNNARSGGGMYNIQPSSPTVTNCVFSGNTATFNGGGMGNEGASPLVTNCTFSGNTANIGGGMFSGSGSPTVTNCTFSGNDADAGGGMFNHTGGPTVTNCMFSGNDADSGGGIYNSASSPTATNCVFSGNTANFDGGGMFNSFSSSPTVTNCTFSGNTASREGGGMLNNDTSSATLTNCILWNNSPFEIINNASSATIAYSIVRLSGGSGAWDSSLGIDGGGNIDVDPLFVDALGPDGVAGTADDDLRLMAGSPCIDAGDYDAYLAAGGGLVDLEGKDRVIDNMNIADTGVGGVTYLDMGAYEQGPCHSDGIINLNDLENLDGCLAGPGGGVGLGCVCVDFNLDEHMDLRDVALFQLDYHP